MARKSSVPSRQTPFRGSAARSKHTAPAKLPEARVCYRALRPIRLPIKHHCPHCGRPVAEHREVIWTIQ